MMKSMRYGATGIISILIAVTNTLFWSITFFPVLLLKIAVPFKSGRLFFGKIIQAIANAWIAVNNAGMTATRTIAWNLTGLEGLRTDRWYLVISNHQSWTDIVVLQKVLFRKVPFLKFFLKKELIWVPILGLAWWALDFPFMKRYTSAFLEKHPHLRGRDVEITRKACAKFRNIPVSVMNFVEGTRFTEEKRARQKSPSPNLLKPKSGGIGFTLTAMGERFTGILNVTIAYPGGPYTFWDFLCGRVRDIRVHVEELPVTGDLLGDYVNDENYRGRIQSWLNELWREKSRTLARLMDSARVADPAL